MHDARSSEAGHRPERGEAGSLHDLERLIEHAAHLLPSQGPITVFVHHNTLHAFEDLPFDEAVRKGAAVFGCHPYLPEDTYRREVSRGRISRTDLAAVLLEGLGEDADFLIGFMGTRYHLRLAMLEHPLRLGSDAELKWLIAETDALRRFREEVPPETSLRLIAQTRHWIQRDYLDGQSRAEKHGKDGDVVSLLGQFGASRIERWGDRTWEAFTLHLLWRICHHGVHGVKRFIEPAPPPIRHRDLMLMATGRDTDLLVHDLLIRFCAAFLDQGFATWPLPGRDAGFVHAFLELFRRPGLVDPWLGRLSKELKRLEQASLSPLASIEESLALLGVEEGEREEYIAQSLLALRGWAGMLWQMETNAEWTARPAPPGTLQQFLAVRLILDRLALRHTAREWLPDLVNVELHNFRTALKQRIAHRPRVSVDQRAYLVFQLAQVRGWGPADLHRLSKAEWSRLVEEIESFESMERRRVYHHAFERRFRKQTLDALSLYSSKEGGGRTGSDDRPAFQVIACLDEREESFRRHLEEVDPSCETFGVAGFFGAAMYYRGVTEAHFRPLCPVNVKPRNYVQEVPIHSFEDASRFQAGARRWLGQLSHRVHVGTRSLLGGLLTGMLGSLATIPLLMRVLLPRRTASIRRFLGRIVTPPLTQLRLERIRPDPGPEDGQLGFSVAEMADVVACVLGTIGLTRNYAPVAIVVGHGSSSLNNPQEAAYDCGACGGARGGPNARALAQMANDLRVRRRLAEKGIVIPEDVYFIGAYHNTCDDGITYFDLDRMPAAHRATLDRARRALDEARRRNAHERCRRFASAELTLTPDDALRHVEGRSEDLSQTRPECGHATNAICIVGRRSRTRGLYLDRRAFLASYDPTQDDPQGTTLAGLLKAVIPVCAGINLEYYFSSIDTAGYGCGTKLPHNVTSLLGVMDGAISDLRPGLSLQMVEIHEPIRLLFVVETSPETLSAIIDGDPAIGQLVRNGWVQLTTLDPNGPGIHKFVGGGFEPYLPTTDTLAVAPSSSAWYRGWRDHLGFAAIVPEVARASTVGTEEVAR